MKAAPSIIALCLALSAFGAFGGGAVCYGYNSGELIAEGGGAASGSQGADSSNAAASSSTSPSSSSSSPSSSSSSRSFRLKRGAPEPVLQPSVPSLDSQAEVEAGTTSSTAASSGGSTSTDPALPLPSSGSAPASSTPLQGGVIENRKFQGVSAVDGLAGRAGITGPIPTTLGAGVATTDSVPAVYQGWLSQAHPQFFLGLSKMSERELVIVTDKYDQTERTLSDTGFRFTEVDKKDFQSFDLTGVKVLVIDCGPRNLSYQSSLKVREFVIKGGYLFTTDWMLDRLNQKFFPGYIAWTGVMNRQRMYDAHIVGEHPSLFQHVATNAYWKMDTHCHLIKILRPDAVRVLAKSDGLAREDGDGVLACVFQYGRGYVLHMTAHFDRSQSANRYSLPDPAPVIGISLRQAIAINFVVAGLSGNKL